MAHNDNSNGLGANTLLTLLAGGVAGGLLTKAWMDHRAAQETKSRAELEEPGLAKAVLEVLDQVFEQVSFRGEFKSERHIMNGLARYLRNKTDLEVEVEPNSPFGIPDILLDGVVALELKKGLKKTEMDRCVGQAAGFSQRWFTVILVFDTPTSKVQRMEDLMADKGLGYIPVVHFQPQGE